MDDRPLVSVVIPVYNRVNVIRRAVESVLGQTYEQLELIVVDGGSTDGTISVLQEIQDERLTLIQQEEDQSANEARNLGIQKGTGELVAFLDSDDCWFPAKLEKQIDRLNQADPEYGVVYCGRWTHRGGFRTYKPPRNMNREGDLSEEIMKYNPVGFIDSLVRREVLDKIGPLDERLLVLQDWDFHIRLSAETKYAFIDEPLLEKFPQPTSISRNQEARVKSHKLLLNKHKSRFQKYDTWPHARFRLGATLCLAGSASEGREHLLYALKNQPIKPLYIGAYVTSLLGSRCFRFVQGCFTVVRSFFNQITDLLSGPAVRERNEE